MILILIIIYWMKNQMEILQLLMLHTKPLLFFDKLDGYLRKFESI